MKTEKSKFIFVVLAFLAILLLVLFSAFIAYGYTWLAVLSIIGFIAVFGFGFSLKAKYRRNDWL
ncbi:DUF5325 family protein [Aliicoccus persicus]|uniref:YlaF family protein n=1 Tax=Aliicoccus persicus TaxID=930138 RepID=A0A662Z0M9_9STAP|nr:DUF5325 family protein [Aliicoccus persicus]SEV80259.1 hypothetical protein SAMN05192557_0070 [Aliicoccus persicus]HJE19244.1 YlaF family protein [Aliicoccus persicus]